MYGKRSGFVKKINRNGWRTASARQTGARRPGPASSASKSLFSASARTSRRLVSPGRTALGPPLPPLLPVKSPSVLLQLKLPFSPDCCWSENRAGPRLQSATITRLCWRSTTIDGTDSFDLLEKVFQEARRIIA